jgi:hypothetical protein
MFMRTRRFPPHRRLLVSALEDRSAPAIFTVTNLANAGVGTLRSAVISANGNPGSDTIDFAPGVVGTITLTTGELAITDPVTINGPGAASLSVSGNNASRVLNISAVPADGDVTITGLTLRDGNVVGDGGAIAGTNQDLSLVDCVITNSTASSDGGGVAMIGLFGGASFAATGCRFTDNKSAVGGGVNVSVPALFRTCTVADNYAGQGGGVYARKGLSVEYSLIANNGAEYGGGVTLVGFGTTAAEWRFLNSTLSGNSGSVHGGGVWHAPYFAGQNLVAQNCTITRNFSPNGGGLFMSSANGTVALESTVLSANLTTGGYSDLASSAFETVSANFNVIGIATVPNIVLIGSGNQTGTLAAPLFPVLTELGDFGGPTLTHALLPGSPCLDKGSNPVPVSADQRFQPRVFNGQADVGAFEVNPTAFLVTETVDEQDGDYSASDLSLREAVRLANASPAGLDTINFNGVVFLIPTTISIVLGSIKIDAPVTVNGPAARLTLDGNGASRIFDTSSAVGGAVVTLNDLTIREGKMGGGTDGGGILVGDQNLILNRCVLADNSVTGDGGALAVFDGGNVLASECTFSGNSAANLGGGVFATDGGTVTFSACTFSNNSAAFGAGVYATANVNIFSSTLFGNSATVGGGGGLRFNPLGAATTAVVRNSTFSGNTAKTNGGGLYLTGLTKTAFVQNCTVTANSTAGHGGGLARGTGGVGQLQIESTIIAQNTGVNGAPDVLAAVGAVVIASANLIGVGDKGDVAWNPAVNLLGTFAAPLDAGLAPLAFNGGATNTHRLLPLSPAFDKGSNPTGAAFDQRGTGYPRTNGPGTDIGAFEAPERIVVSNANDSGPGSLRQAVLDANADADRDLIIFDAAFFGVPRQIKLLSALVGLTDDVEIQGTSAANVTVTRDATAPQFGLFTCSVPGNGTVGLTNLTITGGSVALVGSAGINADDDDLTLRRCIVSNNVTGGSGGAINMSNSAGRVTLIDTTISGNTAVRGGGIYMFNSGTLTMTNCTVSGNVASGVNGGGGLFVGGGTVTARNCTFSGNSATSSGGGGVRVQGGAATLQNCTVALNSAASSGGGLHRFGGTLTFDSTAVAENSVSSGGPDVHGVVTANFSLIGIVGSAIISGANNKIGTAVSPVDPLFGPLSANGGPTLTHALLPGSPCLEAGSNPAGLSTDQRGSAFPRTVGAGTDIGAVENELGLVVINANDAGPGSLRQAVLNANANPGPDVITFDPTFFASARTITLSSGQINITGPATITGPGASLATVSGNNTSRVLYIDAIGQGNAVDISGLSLVNGKTAGTGGAVFNQDEALTLTGCVITGNNATVGAGVAVAGFGGSLTLVRCMVSNNTAGVSGGGVSVASKGTFAIRDSTVAGNVAPEAAGILFVAAGNTGSLLVESSTISGNALSGAGGGGGIRFTYAYGYSTAGSLTVRNSTISGNQGANGGGLIIEAGSLIVQNSTITANTASNLGGGIVVGSGVTAASVTSSIVSGNSNGAAPDIFSPIIVMVNSSAVGASGGFTLSGSGNLAFGAVLNLGPLASNGGPTQTHALIAGSPCLNKGSNPAGLTFDQRGPGFARNVNGAVDIGAHEDQTPAIPARIIFAGITGSPLQRSRVTAVTVQFDRSVTLPTPAENAFELRRQSDNALVDLSPIIGPDFVTFTFNGGLSEFGSLSDGRYTLTVFAAQIDGGYFDGNGDGVPGDDYVLASAGTAGIFRLFGDHDGDADVDASDYGAFRGAFGGASNLAFDYDNDGDVDAADFGQFRARFGTSI